MCRSGWLWRRNGRHGWCRPQRGIRQDISHDFTGGIQQSKVLHASNRAILDQLLDRVERVLARFTNLNGDLARMPWDFRIVKKIDDFRFDVLKRRIIHRSPHHLRVILI